MLVKQHKLVPSYRTIAKTCNRCGKTFSDEVQGYPGLAKIQSLETRFAWGSTFENSSWKFELCDECLRELVRSFTHVPQGFKGIIHEDGMESVSKFEHQKAFEMWKITGVWKFEGSKY